MGNPAQHDTIPAFRPAEAADMQENRIPYNIGLLAEPTRPPTYTDRLWKSFNRSLPSEWRGVRACLPRHSDGRFHAGSP